MPQPLVYSCLLLTLSMCCWTHWLDAAVPGARAAGTSVQRFGYAIKEPEFVMPWVRKPAVAALEYGFKPSDMRPMLAGAAIQQEVQKYPVPDDFWTTIERMPQHTSGTVRLPDGDYKITHESDISYGADGKTWIGYLADNKNFRVLITAGEETLTGTLITPNKRYALRDGMFVELRTAGP